MHLRAAKLLGAAMLVSGLLAATAQADGGPPPPPVASNGATVDQVASGLGTPTSFAFGGGSVFEGDGGTGQEGPPNGGVFLIKGGQATLLPGSPQFVAGVAWHDGALYGSGGVVTGPSGATWELFKWSGWNGSTFDKQQVIYTAPEGFQGFNGVAFGPDGRLYVGADVGLLNGNDHASDGHSPFLYEILSVKPNGRDLRVFARGIRQPWQLAFKGDSPSPFVSALGQDEGITDPLDFVLKVSGGQNYGFPACIWTATTSCGGFATPFKFFAPHTDIMGLAIIGNRLFMTSFAGPHGAGPGGEVLSMSLSTKQVEPFVTGFVAPVVGLGQNAGKLYIGELTGQAFRVTP
jgi:glucose/arabinose dehydrogenase